VEYHGGGGGGGGGFVVPPPLQAPLDVKVVLCGATVVCVRACLASTSWRVVDAVLAGLSTAV